MSATFYFVRHGETDWNAEHRLQGQRDVPLNTRGRRQASRCGKTLTALINDSGRTPADFVFVSSPLSRACETMEIQRQELGLPPQGYATDPRLAELSFGRWEGMTYREIAAVDRPALALRDRDKWGFRPPGGESYGDLLARVGAWYEGVANLNAIVTSHGGVARALMVLFDVRSPTDAPHGNIDQGVVFEFAHRAMQKHW